MFWLFKDPLVMMKKIMSWLFKDLIVAVVLLNFDHAQSINQSINPEKIKLLQINFFYKKTINKTFMYVAPTIAPLIVQNFKNNLITDPEFWRCVIFGSRVAHLPWIKIFW